MRESLWRRLVGGVRRLRQRADWEGFAGPGWADRIMTAAVTDRFHAKQGRSTGRLILHAGSGRLAIYLKRHYHLPRWRGLLAALWPDRGWSPALQEFRHLAWARAAGLPVPAAVAAGEYIGPWGRLQSFLAVEELADMLPLYEAIPAAACRLNATGFQRWKRGLIAELVRLTRALHGQRRFHKDFYLGHFYIARADTQIIPCWPGRVHVIDFHRLAHHPWTWPLWQAKDLGQLLYSSEIPGIEARDRLRFWRRYAGHASHRRVYRWLRWLILFRWRRYRRHNAKRKRCLVEARRLGP
jgi:heptose I phosphotransferase